MAKKILNIIQTGFTAADIPNTKIEGVDGYLAQLEASVKVDLDAGDTLTLQQTLAHIEEFLFYRDGQPMIDIRGDDLVALANLAFGLQPYYIIGAAAEDNKVLGIKIPTWLPRSQWTKNLTYQLDWTAHANITGGILSMKGAVLGKAISAKHLEYLAVAFGNGSNSGINVLDNEKQIVIPAGKEMIGLLIFGTTVPTATADTATVRRIQLSSNGVLKIDTDWDTLGAEALSPAFGDSAVWTAFIDNYRFIDLQDDPFPAGTADLLFSSQAADAVRLVPLMRSSV